MTRFLHANRYPLRSKTLQTLQLQRRRDFARDVDQRRDQRRHWITLRDHHADAVIDIGIAPHSLARLGRPFEQVESQLTKTYHGSGLGLAIARSLAQLHGGSMRLRSKIEVGTVVRVTLPRDAIKAASGMSAAA